MVRDGQSMGGLVRVGRRVSQRTLDVFQERWSKMAKERRGS